MELACNYSSDSHHSEGSDELSPNKINDLTDEHEEIIDDGPAVVSETPKSFLPELKLQTYFSSSAKQPSIKEKVKVWATKNTALISKGGTSCRYADDMESAEMIGDVSVLIVDFHLLSTL